jgi:diguanylate cyclase (GGDEF)-like protein
MSFLPCTIMAVVEVDLRRVEEMLGSIPGESWALVGADGRVTYSVGPRGGILGHGNPAGSHIAEFAHPDALPAVLDGMQAVLAHPRVPVRVLSRAKRADGAWGVFEVTAVNRLDEPAVGAVVVRTREVDEGGAAARDVSLIESLAEQVPTPILVVDHAGYVLFSNAAARELVGDHVEEVIEQLGGQHDVTTTLQLGDRWVQARTARRSDGWVAMLDDITPQHRLAMRDTLTGVANRAAFDARLRSLLGRHDHPPVSVVFVDLDDFKSVNDRHGHAEGDRVLREVADRLVHEVRPTDLVARFGGDEFAVVCDGLDPEAAVKLANRLAGAVGTAASAGAATSPPVPSDAAALVAAADRAMYERKREG